MKLPAFLPARDLSLQALDAVFSTVSALLVLFVVSNHFSASDYGHINMALVLAVVIPEFLDFNLKQYLVKERSDECRIILYSNIVLSMSVAFLAFAFASSFFVPSQMLPYYYTTSILIVLYARNAYTNGILRKKLRYNESALIRIIGYLILILSVIIFTIINLPPYFIVISSVISEVSKSISYAFLKSLPKDLFRHPASPFGIITRSKLMFYGANLAALFARNVDYWVIAALLTASDYGIYVVAYKLLTGPVKQIVGTINKVVYANFGSVADGSVFDADIARYLIAGFALAATLGLAIFMAAPTIVSLVSGPDFARSANVLGALSVGTVGFVTISMLDPLLKLVLASHMLLVRQLINFGIGLTLAFIGSRFGVMGVALGIAASNFVTGGLALALFASAYRTRRFMMLSVAFCGLSALGGAIAWLNWPSLAT